MTADADRGRPRPPRRLPGPGGTVRAGGGRRATRLPADPVHVQMVEHVGRPDPVSVQSVLDDGSRPLALCTGGCRASLIPSELNTISVTGPGNGPAGGVNQPFRPPRATGYPLRDVLRLRVPRLGPTSGRRRT